MIDDSQIHRLMTQAGCGGTLTPAVRMFAQACASLGAAAERERWRNAASIAFDALALDAGKEQQQREADALRELGALLRA